MAAWEFIDVLRIVYMAALVLLLAVAVAGYGVLKHMLNDVRALLEVSKAYSKLAGEQQKEAARIVKAVPQVTKQTVKEAFFEVADEGLDLARRSSESIPEHKPHIVTGDEPP